MSVGVDGSIGAVAAFDEPPNTPNTPGATGAPGSSFVAPPACVYGKETSGYIGTCADDKCKAHVTLVEAQAACTADGNCHGITKVCLLNISVYIQCMFSVKFSLN